MENVQKWLLDKESIIQTYKLFRTELENLYKATPPLVREFKMWPLFSEWISEENFQNRKFKRELKDRLNYFKNRLIKEYPKHKEIIDNYYNLFLTIGINPININKEKDLFDILNKETNN